MIRCVDQDRYFGIVVAVAVSSLDLMNLPFPARNAVMNSTEELKEITGDGVTNSHNKGSVIDGRHRI
jgi:hypothetical protein